MKYVTETLIFRIIKLNWMEGTFIIVIFEFYISYYSFANAGILQNVLSQFAAMMEKGKNDQIRDFQLNHFASLDMV